MVTIDSVKVKAPLFMFNNKTYSLPAPAKIPLQRSKSEPTSNTHSKTTANEQNNIDYLALRLEQQTLKDHDSLETSKLSCLFFQPIRNQPAYRVDHRLSENMQKIMHTKRKQMGKLEKTDSPGFGLGGGILISERDMLVTKHCLDLQRLTDFTIQFEHLNTHSYQIEKQLSVDEAHALGLRTGENGDLIVIRLAEHKQGYPGKDDNFTRLATPKNKKPITLNFMGYTSGNKLKVSTMPGRPIPVTETIQRNINLSGQQATWNEFKTHGEIVTQTPEKSRTKLSIQSPARLHDWTVEEDTIYRSNGTVANAVHECFVLYPNIFADDHVRLAHRTRDGSSGGIYFTEHGEIFAVHCGRLPSEKEYPEHIAFYPWTNITTTLYNDLLVYETKAIPISVSEMLKNRLKNLQKNQYDLSCNNRIIGTLTTVEKTETGSQFTVQPTDTSEQPFIVIIPFDDHANVKVKNNSYSRKDITFTLRPDFKKEDVVVTDDSPALYRVTLSDLKNENGPTEMPRHDQTKFAERYRKGEKKHSMTHNKISYQHITIGESKQDGAHYEFVAEAENEVIAFHAIGTHNRNDSYKISRFSETFKAAAIAKNLWVNSNTESQPSPIFKLNRK